MKNLWNKVPAWIKVILLNCILLFPVISLIQGAILLNMEMNSPVGWAFIVAVFVLTLFWILSEKWSSFERPSDVKIEMNLDLKNYRSWLRIMGLMVFTVAMLLVVEGIFGVYPEGQLQYLDTFLAYEDLVAVPLLAGLALTAGIVEEVVYRGFIQNTLVRAYPKWAAFIGVAVLFTAMHFLPPLLVLGYILVSLAFSLVADEFKSLGVVIVAHVLVDFILFLNHYYGLVDLTHENMLYVAIPGCLLAAWLLLYGNNSVSIKIGVVNLEEVK